MGSQQVLESGQLEVLFGNSNKQQAMQLLGRNIPEGKVADLLDITPAMISQYKEDPLFRQGVRDLLTEQSLAAQIRDERLDALEDLAISQMEKVMGMILRPSEVLGALKVINGLQRRSIPGLAPQQDSGSGARVVQLSIPKGITEVALAVKLNSNQEVVEVNGQELRTMPSADVAKRASLRLPNVTTDASTNSVAAVV